MRQGGGGQGGTGQGRCAESGPGCRTESTYRSRAGGGGARHAVPAADAGHRFRARPLWPQLPLGHCQKQGAGTVKGDPRGEAKGSEECPKLGLKRKESKPRVSQGWALARPCPGPGAAWWQGHQASKELEGAMDSDYPNPDAPACVEGHISWLTHMQKDGLGWWRSSLVRKETPSLPLVTFSS